jgi:hypothetical protein
MLLGEVVTVNGKSNGPKVSSYTNDTPDYSENLAAWGAGRYTIPQPTVINNQNTTEKVAQPLFMIDGNVFTGVVAKNMNMNMNRGS